MVQKPTIQVARLGPWSRLAALAFGVASCRGTPPFPAVPSAAEVRALIAQGSGSNMAATDPTAADSRLGPRVFPMPMAQAAARLTATVNQLPRWKILETTDSVIWATRSTRLFQFTDDIVILLVPLGDSTRVEARSSSRLGKGDLGQNRRNLAELWGAALVRSSAPSTS